MQLDDNLNHASGVPVQDLLHRSRYGADKAFLGVLSREPWGSATASICMQRSRLEISRAAAGYSTLACGKVRNSAGST